MFGNGKKQPSVPSDLDAKLAQLVEGLSHASTAIGGLTEGHKQHASTLGEHGTRLGKLEEVTTLIATRLEDTHDQMIGSQAKLSPQQQASIKAQADSIVADALKDAYAGGRKSFVVALRARNMSDDDIRQALGILASGEPDEVLDLEDHDVVAELVTCYIALHSTVARHSEDLTQVKGRTTHLEHAHGELRSDHDKLRSEHEKLSKTVQTVTTSGGARVGLAAIIALVVGVITFIVWRSQFNEATFYAATTTAQTAIGDVTATVSVTPDSLTAFGYSIWGAIVISLLVAAIIFFLLAALLRTSSKTTVTEKKTEKKTEKSESTTQADSQMENLDQQFANQNPTHPRTRDANAAVDPDPTMVLPAQK